MTASQQSTQHTLKEGDNSFVRESLTLRVHGASDSQAFGFEFQQFQFQFRPITRSFRPD